MPSYSARHGGDHAVLLGALRHLEQLPITPAIEDLALLAQTDYDVIATQSGLRFSSEWLAPAGSLD